MKLPPTPPPSTLWVPTTASNTQSSKDPSSKVERRPLADGLARDEFAIDLGSTTISVASRRKGFLFTERSLIARDALSDVTVAVGGEAAHMIGRNPDGLSVTSPIKRGIIADPEGAVSLLRTLLRRAGFRRSLRPRVVVCIPAISTAVERRAAREVLYRVGAGDVRLLGHPLAGALGAGLGLDQPEGVMSVAVGASTIEAGVLCLGGVVSMESAAVGSSDLDRAIQTYLRDRFSLSVSTSVAEHLKKTLATAPRPASWATSTTGLGLGDGESQRVKGRRVGTGKVIEVQVSRSDLSDAVHDVVTALADVVVRCVVKSPAEIANDLATNGICLVGRGADFSGFKTFLSAKTRLPVATAPNSAVAGVCGALRCLGHHRDLHDLFLADSEIASATRT